MPRAKTKGSSSIEDLLTTSAKTTLQGKQPASQPASGNQQQKTAPKKGKAGADMTAAEKLEAKLSAINIDEEEAKVAQKAQTLNAPYINLAGFPISAEALRLIPETISQEQKTVCFVDTGAEIRIGTTNPQNPEIDKIKHSLEEASNSHADIYMISELSLKKALDLYATLPKYKPIAPGVEISEAELEKFKQIGANIKELEEHLKKVNITEMVTLIVAASIQAGSSDIHIEAEEKDIKVRFRVDGILHDAASIAKTIWPKVIARVKLLAGLKINITDKPQDGRFTIVLTNDKIDVRVSCLPTGWGESVVMRLLKSSSVGLKFDDLGVFGQAEKNLRVQCERPNGMIITTGPTGSGKTTTLYAVLNKLNKEDVKIVTLEDPIEYRLAGVNQSQIDHSKGYSFADGLRSILRQDPDIVMVGEMRDLETTEVAINAALTGHLVLSTIHTNSAAGAIPRFLAMNVKPFLLAPALNAIIGQRLVRRICEKCKEEFSPEAETIERVKKTLSAIPENNPDRPKFEQLKFYHGKGCETCNGLGYKGRVGIYEIMIMNPEIEKVILGGKVSEYDMEQLAIKNGMITMAQDGLIKALQGMTTVEEVFRVSE